MIDLIKDLSEFGYPVFAEGDAPQELPNEYFTISEDSSSNNVNADNEPTSYAYEFTLKWYTNKADNLYLGLINAIQFLKKKSYIISGVGCSNSTYQNTWWSRQVDVKKIEYLN